MESQIQRELASETDILHLIYYRNKNQHRQASWWKFLSILHRKCQQLVSRLTEKQDSESLTKFILEKILPTAYISFKGMVAQGQYINLGFALLACAAKISSLLLSIREAGSRKARSSKKMATISEELDLGEKLSRESFISGKKAVDHEKSLRKNSEEKEDDKSLKSKHKDKTTKLKDKEQNSSGKDKTKKKKKKSKNAIDEIFGF